MKNHFAENLKTLRIDKKLTQPQLALALNVSKATISFWENNINEPTATNIIKIAQFFNITIDELLTTLI